MAYFDAASAEPLHPAAREAWLAAVDSGWADPARLHAEGRRAALLLDAARESVAVALGAYPDEVSFTSSGTSALHLAIGGTLADVPCGLVVSAVEHSAVLHAAAAHQRRGGNVTTVGVDRTGRVDIDTYVRAVTSATVPTTLAVLQTANHEVGSRQPVHLVAQAAAEAGVPLLVDAAQTVGREPVPAGWALLAGSAHKWGGPAGVGVLAVRRQVRWSAPVAADGREGDRVPGPPDVPGAVAAAAALEAVTRDQRATSARLHELTAVLRRRLPALVPDVEVLGEDRDRSPHLVTFSCLYVDGEALVTELSRLGHSVSSGSSCTASTLHPSHVLAAMGVLTSGNVRVSLPRATEAAEVEQFLDDLPGAVARVRAQAGALGL